MADDKISFLLDLDNKDFLEKGKQAFDSINKIGDKSNLAGLLGAFDSMLPILATAGIAMEGFKKAIDLTVEGEELERVNRQFETLTKSAGIAPNTLRAGLEKASLGLADTSDLIKIANENLIKMGSSSARLPELMTLATKATEVYGGTAKGNFEALSQAMANGNTRTLQHYGILVDATQAQRKFAEAQGVTVDQLSEAGKKQAIFNAAIDSGNRAFKDITVNTESATNILQSLKATFSDIGEVFTVVFEKTMGPGIRSFLHSVQTMASSVKLHLKANIGEGAEAAAASLELAQGKLTFMEKEIKKLESIKGTWKDVAPAETISRLQTLTNGIERQRAVVLELQKQNQEAQRVDDENSAKRTAHVEKNSQENLIDIEKREKQLASFNAMSVKADQELLNERIKNVQTLTEIDAIALKQRELENAQFMSRIKQIESSTALDKGQKDKLVEIENATHQKKMQSLEAETDQFRKKLLDGYVKTSTSAFGGIERAFVANSQKMKLEQADFGKRGEETWNSLSSNATAAFTNMGAEMAKGKDIGTATADALKGVFLGMLGDRAIAEGNILLLSSIWPPNPLGLTAGAGLIALGGALKAFAGASGAPATAAAGPSSQAVASGSAPKLEPISSGAVETQKASAEGITETAIPQMEQQQRTQRSVSVNIAGNYLETDQTKRMLMDLMRQESDATGFSYTQIGA